MANKNPKPPIGKRNAAKPAELHKVQTSITLSKEAMAKLDDMAQANGVNRSQMIERLIREAENSS